MSRLSIVCAQCGKEVNPTPPAERFAVGARPVGWSVNNTGQEFCPECTTGPKPLVDERRKGELAYIPLKFKLRQEGIKLNTNFKREVGRIAREINEDPREMSVFLETLVRELVHEMFPSGASERPEKPRDHWV